MIKTCPNCGENLTGIFCANCGQKVKNLNVPFKEVVSEVVENTLTFDSRFFRTLIPLITKPGFLTVEYNLGRRFRYVTPFRLYVFISFILFFMLSTIDVKIVKFTKGPSKRNSVNCIYTGFIKDNTQKTSSRLIRNRSQIQEKVLEKIGPAGR